VKQTSHRHVDPTPMFQGRGSHNRSVGNVDERSGIP
jgi:hypothetical protein